MMKYYKDLSGIIYAFESDGSQDHLVTDDMLELSEDELDNHLNPKQTYQQALASLSATYQKDVDSFNRSFATAYLADGPSQESKQAVIRSQYLARKDQHAVDVKNLKDSYAKESL